MANWKQDELDKINSSDELEIASLKADGKLRQPVPIWVVRIGNNLYIRSVRGRKSAWFRATQIRYAGQVSAGGVEKDVTYEEETDRAVSEEIDEAYRQKYHKHPKSVLDSILTPQARSATLKLVPR